MPSLYQLFSECISADYTEVENAASYFLKRVDDVLYIYLECSNGIRDWQNNFDFPAKAYRNDTPYPWFCHRGFLKVWKSLEPYLKNDIMDEKIKSIYTVGYSHGAALALLCHEYIWYNRPNLRNLIFGVGFGCPRVVFGAVKKEVKERWSRFIVVRNINDIVTHLPPVLFGYKHVGNLISIGKRCKYTMVDAHRPENILIELSKEKEKTIADYIEKAL